MPKIAYKHLTFHEESLRLISIVNGIIAEYSAQGYELTLRQTYYQLVARGYIPNTEKSYKNIGKLINDGRLTGLIDWNAIVDRTRNLRVNPHWDSPEDIIWSAAKSYMIDRWENQKTYVEVWIEKDALIGIAAKACEKLDVPYFSCRGYTSQSEMWRAAQRFIKKSDKVCRIIIHLGDHDPSGIDMTRDIQERLDVFGASVYVNRIALTMDQIKQYNPPPNPTKLSDSRANSYISKYGLECWELDALEPNVIEALIQKEINDFIWDKKVFQKIADKEHEQTLDLEFIAHNYDRVIEFLDR